MKTRFPFLMIATLAAASLSLFFTSCNESFLNSDATPDLKSLSGNSISSSNISVDWNNWTHGSTYTVAMAIADFGHISGFTQAEQTRTMISEGRLRVQLLKDVYGSNGGVITATNVPEGEGYELTFRMRFHAAFDFAQKGGRLGFGFKIGDGAAVRESGEGGSFSLAWDIDENGDTYFKPYVYYADQSGSSGEHFGKRWYPASGSIGGSNWYNVKMVFKANTYLDRNGRSELYINNIEVLNMPIRWTKNHLKRFVNQLTFSNYRSGVGSQSPTNGLIYFDDFQLISTTPTYTPTWCDSVYTLTRLYDAISNTYYHLTEIKHKDNNEDVIKLMHGHAAKVEGETGTEFARRMDCCLAFNASMAKSGLPTSIREPVGVQIINGNIVQNLTYGRYTLGIKDENELLAYVPWETPTNILNDGVNDALTAFIPLIENHGPVSQSVINSVGNSSVKHPRQAIAQFDNGNILFLSCGGRGYDGEGMTAQDLIRILSALDVRFAYNLDGGGSTTTMINGELITPKIDGSGTQERRRPNWLYVEYDHGD